MREMIISVIKLILLPPGGLLLLVMVSSIFYKKRAGMLTAVIGLLVLVIVSLPVVTNKFAQYWERFPALHTASIKQFSPQAIVVIGGGLEHGAAEYQSGWTVNSRTLVRLRYAAKLAKETGTPVLVSGGVPDATDVSEAGVMASVLTEEFSVPVDWREEASRNTAENARFSRNVLGRYGVERILLVTHAYHMSRAELEFRKAGFQVLPAPTAFIGKAGGFSLFDWFPSAAALEDVFLLSHECLGMLWYRFRY